MSRTLHGKLGEVGNFICKVAIWLSNLLRNWLLRNIVSNFPMNFTMWCGKVMFTKLTVRVVRDYTMFCASRDTRISYDLVLINTGIFLRGSKLCGEGRT